MVKKKYMYMHLIGMHPATFDGNQIHCVKIRQCVQVVPTLKQIKREQQQSKRFTNEILKDDSTWFYNYCKVLLPK